MNKVRFVFSIFLGSVSAAYPLLWLFSAQKYPVVLVIIPYLLALLWIIRAILQPNKGQRIFAAAMALLLTVIAFTRAVGTMYWYPVIISSAMLMVFGGSLFSRQSLIERLARLQTPDLSLKGVKYTRKVTQLWCVFFLFNIILTTALILTRQYAYWAIYTGIIAYIIMGVLMLGEWLVRKKVMEQ